MIVFDLRCSTDHVFEAWFANSASFEDQCHRGLLSCPYCGDTAVEKAVMAPRLGPKSNQIVTTAPSTPAAPDIKSMLATIAKAQGEALKSSTWVGPNFESQARAMEAGDIPTVSIHGQATLEQARDLVEDGIAVLPLLVPFVPPDQRN